MSKDYVEVRGTEEHNLENLGVCIPCETFTVVTGLSGSGKSSLALDTVYAEGQRRYTESLSAYAWNFLGQMDRPKTEAVEGFPPAISIDQKNGADNPRSAVGTVAELHDYLRLLYARVGTRYDPITNVEVDEQSAQDMVNQILGPPEETRMKAVAPIARGRKGEFKDLFSDLVSEDYARIEVDGREFNLLFETPDLNKDYDHTIDVVVDHVKVAPEAHSRIADSVETTLEKAGGALKLIVPDPPADLSFAPNTRSTGSLVSESNNRLVAELSEELGNPNSLFQSSEIETRSFSFSSPCGACPECEGLGRAEKVNPDPAVTDPSKPLKHVSEPWGYNQAYHRRQFDNVADRLGAGIDTPLGELSGEIQDASPFGTNKDVAFEQTTENGTRHKEHPFEGVVGDLGHRRVETDSDRMRDHIEEFVAVTACPDCNGSQLRRQSRHVRVGGMMLPEINRMTIADALEHFESLEADLLERHRIIVQEILKEICACLGFMTEVGLEYLTLDRKAAALSGDESQRIHLVTQAGSGLVGIFCVLDEPSIGLHQRGNGKLLNTLEGLRDLGNTLIIIEHDEKTVRRADEIIGMGPGPDKYGDEVVAQGDFDDIVAVDGSITTDYLSGRKDIDAPESRREGDGKLVVCGACQHNLDNLDVLIPLEAFTAVTGVSGSGKSTLMHEILYKGLARRMSDNTSVDPDEHGAIEGYDDVEAVRLIDQSPTGRTPRSNPATCTGVFSYVRELFAETRSSRQRGYEKERFSLNVKGGRCEVCKGQGNVKIEMNFLSDVYVPCEEYNDAHCNAETLDTTYKDKTIAGVLDMEVDEVLDFFEANSQTRRRLQLLHDVGLGYMQLDQPSTMPSDGEAQRVKLTRKLDKEQTNDTLYLLGEPMTGLYKEDERKLIEVLQRLIDNGNTMLTVEHKPDLMKNADHIVDLDPEGGAGDGTIVASGTSKEIAANPDSHTGRYLHDYLSDMDEEGLQSDRCKSTEVANDDD